MAFYPSSPAIRHSGLECDVKHHIELTEREQRMFDQFTAKRHVIVPDWPDAHTVMIKVGVQSFDVNDPRENPDEADWMRAMIAKALAAVVESDQP
jgi:hypothetical protein